MRAQRLIVSVVLLAACASVDEAVLGALPVPPAGPDMSSDAAAPLDAGLTQPVDASFEAADASTEAALDAAPVQLSDAAITPTDAALGDTGTTPRRDSAVDDDDLPDASKDAASNPLCILEPWHCTP